ncbi:MAG: GtrA family protein [Victivallaceae bacterium]|nr:GtrA family protein [Victivallaceae bacterium]
MMLSFLKKYQEIIRYLIVGVLTTALSMAVYFFLFYLLGKGSLAHCAGRLATVVSWVVAVLFAFFANKLAVFKSRSMAPGVFWREFLLFFGCRAATLAFDFAFIWVTVDFLAYTAWAQMWDPHYAALHGYLMKLVDEFFVTVFNYVISKFWIFAQKRVSANAPD